MRRDKAERQIMGPSRLNELTRPCAVRFKCLAEI